MQVKARRGVCIGVDRHLKPDDTADLDAALVTYLVGIGAVEIVPEKAEPKPADEPERKTTDELDLKPTPEKSGKKEK